MLKKPLADLGMFGFRYSWREKPVLFQHRLGFSRSEAARSLGSTDGTGP
jgi:hypothetical protein